MPYFYDCGGDGSGGGGGSDPTFGSTAAFVGSLSDANVALIPPVEGNYITDYSIRCAVDQPNINRLEFSIDGANWLRLKPGEGYWDQVKDTRQLQIRAGSSEAVNYEIILQLSVG